MVEQPDAWRWSSYRATVGGDQAPPCLTTDWLLGQFSAKRDKAGNEYRQFVKQGIGNASIWKDIKGQRFLGEDDFVDELTGRLLRHREVPGIPKSQRSASRPALHTLFSATMLKDSKKRDRTIALAVGSTVIPSGQSSVIWACTALI